MDTLVAMMAKDVTASRQTSYIISVWQAIHDTVSSMLLLSIDTVDIAIPICYME